MCLTRVCIQIGERQSRLILFALWRLRGTIAVKILTACYFLHNQMSMHDNWTEMWLILLWFLRSLIFSMAISRKYQEKKGLSLTKRDLTWLDVDQTENQAQWTKNEREAKQLILRMFRNYKMLLFSCHQSCQSLILFFEWHKSLLSSREIKPWWFLFAFLYMS